MDIKEQIRLIIYHAIERGETLEQAVLSLINAGYSKEDVFSVANEILSSKALKEKELIEIPKYKEKIVKEKIEKEEKKEIIKEKVNLKAKIVTIFSLIFILYYLIILIIKYKNFITFIWILFGIPCLITNIYFLVKNGNKKTVKILILINLISFIGLLLFIIIPNRDHIIELFKLIFSKKLFFIFPSFVLAILLSIISLLI